MPSITLRMALPALRLSSTVWLEIIRFGIQNYSEKNLISLTINILWQVIRTDIVMDLGESINPAIDIGQIEGAFVQGYGLFTLEELIVSPTGTLYSRGPGMYKIPGFSDIPAEFNVSLLRGAPNPRAVYSSKVSSVNSIIVSYLTPIFLRPWESLLFSWPPLHSLP